MENDDAKLIFGWGIGTVLVSLFIVLLAIGLTLIVAGFRPTFLDIQRQQDVASRQNVAGQQQIIADDIQDYNKLANQISFLQSQPESTQRDQNIQQLQASQKADIQNAHEQADNLTSISVLPKSQQDWLNSH